MKPVRIGREERSSLPLVSESHEQEREKPNTNPGEEKETGIRLLVVQLYVYFYSQEKTLGFIWYNFPLKTPCTCDTVGSSSSRRIMVSY